jgi:hypothetical protein
MEHKFCKNCRHILVSHQGLVGQAPDLSFSRCDQFKRVDLVSGVSVNEFCSDARADSSKCGQTGKCYVEA